MSEATPSPSKPSQQEDMLLIIKLLAGTAQAGSKGVVAQAALNVMLASEAVVKSRQMKLAASIQDVAMSTLNKAKNTLFKASNVEGAMEQAKQDIIKNKQKTYDPNINS